MRGQINLDFLMKFFISVVAVLMIILALYYFGADFAKFFGVDFKLQKTGVHGGNLNALKLEITSEKEEVLDYNACLDDCNKNGYSSDCESFCAVVCNSTGSCAKYTFYVDMFVPEENDVEFTLNLTNYGEVPALNNPQEVLAGHNNLKLIYVLPRNKNNAIYSAQIFTYYEGNLVSNTTVITESCSNIGYSCETNDDCCKYFFSQKTVNFILNDSQKSKVVKIPDNKGLIVTGTLISNDLSSVNMEINCTSEKYIFINNTHKKYTLSDCSGDVKFSVEGDNNEKFNLSVLLYEYLGAVKKNVICNENKCQAVGS